MPFSRHRIPQNTESKAKCVNNVSDMSRSVNRIDIVIVSPVAALKLKLYTEYTKH